MYNKKMRYALIVLLLLAILTASWHVLHGTINFNTDIARDFLLFEDIYYGRHITLLGPRSGGIPGVFHGPLWLYLNVPAYAIGGGNPVVVGWWWVILFVVSVCILFYSVKTLAGGATALLAAAIYAFSTANTVHAMFNPFGAVMLAPLFLLFTFDYLRKGGFARLAILMFVLGLMIQFQMAFAVPMFVLIAPLLLYVILKRKTYKDLLAIGFLIIPLSTFILFDLRHDFLQMRAVISYLGGGENALPNTVPFTDVLYERFVKNMMYGALAQLVGYDVYAVVGAWLMIGYGYLQRKDNALKQLYYLFMYIFIGFWIITLPYKGVIWGYYVWPFVGLFAYILALSLDALPLRLKFTFLALFLFVQMNERIAPMLRMSSIPVDPSSWRFYQMVAEGVYADAPHEFGYYIYTNDQYGYSTRYAMNYVGRINEEKKAYPFAKKSTTYLLIDDPGDHKYTNNRGWKKYDVKIDKKLVKKSQISKTYWIEKYQLSDEEQKIESNPNLIQNLIFR